MKVSTKRKRETALRLAAMALCMACALSVWSGTANAKEEPKPAETHTALKCVPAAAEPGQSVHCFAVVGGVTGSKEGLVVFKSENEGSFSSSSCAFAVPRGEPGSCGVAYTPSDDGAAKHVIHAYYTGDAANGFSEASFSLQILGKGGEEPGEPAETHTALKCSSTSAEPGQSVHCVAMVSGVTGSKEGLVKFVTENGTFSPSTCAFAVPSGEPGTCGVDYVPAKDGYAKHVLIAEYVGDAANSSSYGAFSLQILGGGKEGEAGPGKLATALAAVTGATAKAHRAKRKVCKARCGSRAARSRSVKRR